MRKTYRFSDTENNRRESDIGPIQLGGIRVKKRGLYMDEAISKTNFGLFNYIVIFLSGIILITVANETVNPCYMFPVAECDLNLSTSNKGILAGAPYIGMILSSHLWGFLADTKGRRRVIQPTLLVAFLVSVASSFVQNFYLFTALRFLSGFFISGCSATIFAYLSEFHSKKYRARAIMGASVIYAVFMVITPLIAWIVINQDFKFPISFIDIVYKPWRLYIVTGSLFGFLSFLIISFLPESPKFVLSQGKQAEAYLILQKINRINNGKESVLEPFELYEESESVESRRRFMESKSNRYPFLSSLWIQTAPLFSKSHLSPTILLCTIQFCIYSVTNGFQMFLPEILNRMATNTDDYFNQRAMMCNVINMKSQPNDTSNDVDKQVCIDKLELETLEQGLMGEVIYIIGQIFIIFLIDKVGKFPILFVILVGTGVCGISTILHSIPVLQIAPLLLHIVLCGLAGNILNAAAVEIYPTPLRGMAVCISLMFARVGGVFGSNICGILLENHCEVLFGLSGSLLIAAGTLTYFLPKVHQKMEQEPDEILNEPRASIFSARFK